MLENLHPLSVKGYLLLVKMLIYHGDIAETFGGASDDSWQSFKKAETILLDQVKI